MKKTPEERAKQDAKTKAKRKASAKEWHRQRSGFYERNGLERPPVRRRGRPLNSRECPASRWDDEAERHRQKLIALGNALVANRRKQQEQKRLIEAEAKAKNSRREPNAREKQEVIKSLETMDL